MVPKTPNGRSAEKKLKAVLEAASLSDEQLGAFLRSKGIHETHLEQWRTLSESLPVATSSAFAARRNGR